MLGDGGVSSCVCVCACVCVVCVCDDDDLACGGGGDISGQMQGATRGPGMWEIWRAGGEEGPFRMRGSQSVIVKRNRHECLIYLLLQTQPGKIIGEESQTARIQDITQFLRTSVP